PVLTESDLLAIAETRADEYLIAMSERDRLDAAITDALIRRGSEAVRRGVTGNSGATFTVQTLRHLLEVAVEDRDVKRNLFARGDLPAHFRELLSDAARFDGDDDKPAPDDETALLVGRIVEDFAAAAGLKPRQVRAMIEGDRLEPTVVIGRALELTE